MKWHFIYKILVIEGTLNDKISFITLVKSINAFGFKSATIVLTVTFNL